MSGDRVQEGGNLVLRRRSFLCLVIVRLVGRVVVVCSMCVPRQS